MSTPNIRLQVQEALDKGWVINAELRQARSIAQDARNAFNALKGEIGSDTYQREGDARAALQVAAHAKVHEKAMEAAQVRLDAALAIHAKAKAVADDARQAADGKTAAEWAKELSAHRRELDLKAAAAQAETHQAEQKANELAVSLDRYRLRMEAQFGTSVGKLLEIG